MRIDHAGGEPKGWLFGPWNSEFGVSIGYANQAIDEPHLHTELTEIYLVARGFARVRFSSETVEVRAGDVLTIEPGEGHTFLESSADYFHFVVQTPGFKGAEAQAEKVAISRSDLGL